MKVAVVGGGVNGCFIAYYLSKRGHEVLLIDREENALASVNNAGLLTPELSPSPPVSISKLVKASIIPSGPLYFSITQILKNPSWMTRALRGIREDSKESLVNFGRYSLKLYEEFFEKENCKETVSYRKGMIALYKADGKGELSRNDIEGLGYQGFGSGHYLPEELSIDSHKLMQVLRELLNSSANVTTRRAEVRGFSRESRRVNYLITDKGEEKADTYVLAAGSRTAEICRFLGFDTKILPARGLVMLFDTAGKEIVKSPAMLEDYGSAVAQHSNSMLRATTFFELKGFDRNFSKGRKEWLLNILRKHITNFSLLKPVYEGVGFRPCTPDQLPLIGRCPNFENVYLATGHCRVGMTLAPATGVLVNDMLEGRHVDGKWARAFDPVRFL